jgi:single-strand DNA-binding protein
VLPEINGTFGVVADPEYRVSGSGKGWASLRVVSKDRTRDSNGEWVDGEALFLNCVVFGKWAENLVESVVKGDTIQIRGRLKPNIWTDKEGVEHRDVQIVADEAGASFQWNPAKTPRMLESAGVGAAVSGLGATEQATTEPPF